MILRNIEIVSLVARQLGILNHEVVYVGGATTVLMVPPGFEGAVRQTKDVDVIINVFALNDYYQFVEKVKQAGFTEDLREGAPLCRFRSSQSSDLILDVMPTDPSILGFSNIWYPQAIAAAELQTVNGVEIRLVTPAYFLATKFEAWLGRGDGDYFSHDMEDIVFVLENRPTTAQELETAEPGLKSYLGERAKALLASDFEHYAEGMTASKTGFQNLMNNLARMKFFVNG